MKKLLAVLTIALLLTVTACDKLGIATPTATHEPGPPATISAPTTLPADTATAGLPTATAVPPTAAPQTGAPTTATAGLPAATATVVPASPTAAPTEPPTATPVPLANIPIFQGMALLYHVEGGIAGLCRDLAVFEDGRALYGSCGGLAQGTLDEAQLAPVLAWQKELAPFQFRFEDNPKGPDNMSTTLVFSGKGSAAATAEQQQAVVSWAQEALAALAGQTATVDRTIAIDQPAPGAVLTSPVLVTGEGMAFESQLPVRVLDEEGNLIGQTVAFINAEMGQRGRFSAEVTFTQPAREQAGRVVVFDTSPRDGSIITLSSVEVRLAAAGEGSAQALIVAPNLLAFQGSGFTLPYLSDTVVETAGDNTWTLVGRSVDIRPAKAEWTWSAPAYRLDVELLSATAEVTTEEWVREHLLSGWKKAQEKGEPFTGPVDSAGKIIEERLALVRVGDKAAVQVDWFGGDSTRRAVYVSLHTRIAVLWYSVYPVENYPLAEAASDVCGLLAAQLSAPEAQGVPNTLPQVEGVTDFIGPGFQFLVPAHAVVEEVEADHWQILGPEVDVRAAQGEAAWSGPAYQADLVLEANPDGLTAAAWAEQVLQKEQKQALESKKAFTGPLDADGKLIAGRVAEVLVGEVAGVTAAGYQTDWLGENGMHRIVYVPAAGQMLAVHYDLLAQEANPVAPLANAAQALLLAGLRVGSN